MVEKGVNIVNTKNNVSGNTSLRLGKRYTVLKGNTKKWIAKKKIKHGAQFATYAGPTVKAAKGIGAAAMGTGKFLLKRGALGFPGLIATGAYLGAKKLGTKYGRGYSHVAMRQFDKKGRKRI